MKMGIHKPASILDSRFRGKDKNRYFLAFETAPN